MELADHDAADNKLESIITGLTIQALTLSSVGLSRLQEAKDAG